MWFQDCIRHTVKETFNMVSLLKYFPVILTFTMGISCKSVLFEVNFSDSIGTLVGHLQSKIATDCAAACIEHDKCNAFFIEEFQCDLLYHTSSIVGSIKIWKGGEQRITYYSNIFKN